MFLGFEEMSELCSSEKRSTGRVAPRNVGELGKCVHLLHRGLRGRRGITRVAGRMKAAQGAAYLLWHAASRDDVDSPDGGSPPFGGASRVPLLQTEEEKALCSSERRKTPR